MPLLKKLLRCLAGNQDACGSGVFSKNVIVGFGDKKDKFFKPQSKLGKNFNLFPGNADQNRSPPSVSGPEGFQEKQSTSSHCPSVISPVSELVEKEFQDPEFCKNVAGLERMLRVRARSHSAGSPARHVGTCLPTVQKLPELVAGFQERSLDRSQDGILLQRDDVGSASGSAEFVSVVPASVINKCDDDPLLMASVDTVVDSSGAGKHDLDDGIVVVRASTAVVGSAEYVSVDPVSVINRCDDGPSTLASVDHAVDFLETCKHDLEDGVVAGRATTAGERNHSRLLEVIESVFLSLISVENSSPSSLRVSSHTRAREICLAAVSACLSDPHSACRSLPALTDAHADDSLMHFDVNSGRLDTGNSLAFQRCRKVRQSRTVRFGSVDQTVDMSPALAAGTYRRSVDEMHGQRQVSRKRWAESSWGGPGPGPGLGPCGRSGMVGGSLGCAAAIRGIPCSLVMPPGRHQRAPQSLGWEWVCGTEKSGVWVLKGDARTYNLPRNLDDVGIVWEHRSGYETAWATPGHVCSCSYGYGHGPVLPQPNPSVFTEAIKLWSRVASLLTPWCAKGEVPTGVNLNRYAGDGSCIPWHCDNEGLFGSPGEPKVIVSMSLGHSVLFKLRRRASEKTVTSIWLDHGDLLVMDGLTQEEFLHSTASELEGPRVNLTYRWISQHIRSCPQAGLICGALPSVAPDLAEPNSCRGRSRKSK